MGFKKLYNDNQWEILCKSVGFAFLGVAKADGVIDKKEAAAMNNIIDNAGKYDMELVDEVLLYLKDNNIDIVALAKKDNISSADGLSTISTFLKVVDDKNANNFKKFLISVGLYIGAASGKFLRDKIDANEYKEIVKIGRSLNYNLESVLHTGAADKILNILK